MGRRQLDAGKTRSRLMRQFLADLQAAVATPEVRSQLSVTDNATLLAKLKVLAQCEHGCARYATQGPKCSSCRTGKPLRTTTTTTAAAAAAAAAATKTKTKTMTPTTAAASETKTKTTAPIVPPAAQPEPQGAGSSSFSQSRAGAADSSERLTWTQQTPVIADMLDSISVDFLISSKAATSSRKLLSSRQTRIFAEVQQHILDLVVSPWIYAERRLAQSLLGKVLELRDIEQLSWPAHVPSSSCGYCPPWHLADSPVAMVWDLQPGSVLSRTALSLHSCKLSSSPTRRSKVSMRMPRVTARKLRSLACAARL